MNYSMTQALAEAAGIIEKHRNIRRDSPKEAWDSVKADVEAMYTDKRLPVNLRTGLAGMVWDTLNNMAVGDEYPEMPEFEEFIRKPEPEEDELLDMFD